MASTRGRQSSTRSTSRGRRRASRTPPARRWSQKVTRESDALDLEGGVFTFDDPRRIARSLKRSAEQSQRRKAEPFRSAMSMLNLYINRAGRGLPAKRRRVLERAKDELRAAFGRATRGRARRPGSRAQHAKPAPTRRAR